MVRRKIDQSVGGLEAVGLRPTMAIGSTYEMIAPPGGSGDNSVDEAMATTPTK
jgi:hypothetical protein